MSIPEVSKSYQHVPYEGKGEVPLRFLFEQKGWRILTNSIELGMADEKGRAMKAIPDMAICLKNGYQFCIYDDGGVHFEPRQIDKDLFYSEALRALGYKVIRIKHKNPITEERGEWLVQTMQKLLNDYTKIEWIDLDKMKMM